MPTRRTSDVVRPALGRGLVLLVLTLLFGASLLFTQNTANAAIPDQVFTIQQASNGRYLDAWDDGSHDYSVVTRPQQYNTSQEWLIHWDESGTGTGTIQQLSTGRYLDAHEISELDYRLVTRPYQDNDTQRWTITSVGGGNYTIQQVSNGRYMDAHEYAERDYGVVSRDAQYNPTQYWTLTLLRQI